MGVVVGGAARVAGWKRGICSCNVTACQCCGWRGRGGWRRVGDGGGGGGQQG